MAKVLIVYASDWGNTEKMAKQIAAGVKSVSGCTAELKTALDATAEDVVSADALVLGSPVHMGSADSRVKQFIDKVCSGLWMKDKLNGKVGAVFATGGGFGSAGGGCEITMIGLLSNLADLGMVIIPLPKNTPGYAKGGLHWGPYGRSQGENMEQTGLPDDRTEAAHHHGIHIAKAALLLKGQKIF